MASITVVGSVNRDVVLQVRALPRPGETVHAVAVRESVGGKGANQAVAAARLGSDVRLVAKIGADAQDVLASLAEDGVQTRWIETSESARTGTASITVDASGENVIVLNGGANLELTAADLPDPIAQAGDVLMVQGEISPEVTEAAITQASAQGAVVLLNPAPAFAFDAATLKRVDVLVPNLGELCALLDAPVPASLGGAIQLVTNHTMPATAVVVTLGADGAIVRDHHGVVHIPAPSVTAIDTVGAGDTFCGALADSLIRGFTLRAAAERAVVAAALAVTGRGAQRAMPTAAELAQFAEVSASAARSARLDN